MLSWTNLGKHGIPQAQSSQLWKMWAPMSGTPTENSRKKIVQTLSRGVTLKANILNIFKSILTFMGYGKIPRKTGGKWYNRGVKAIQARTLYPE